LTDFNETSILTGFFKNTQNSNFMKLHPVGTAMTHVGSGWIEGQIDKARLIVAFHYFAKCT
jgi:hypothetical protein